jgi:hypothetical protein
VTDDLMNAVPVPDPAAGTWQSLSDSLSYGDDPPAREVNLTFKKPSKAWVGYKAGGTTEHPVLWTYVGDPDDGELCVLRKEP